MSVTVFPRRHAAQRQPGTFVLDVPHLTVTVVRQAFIGVPQHVQTAVAEETAAVQRLLDQAMEHAQRFDDLLAPFCVETSA